MDNLAAGVQVYAAKTNRTDFNIPQEIIDWIVDLLYSDPQGPKIHLSLVSKSMCHASRHFSFRTLHLCGHPRSVDGFNLLVSSPLETITSHIRNLRIGDKDHIAFRPPFPLDTTRLQSLIDRLPALECIYLEHLRWVCSPAVASRQVSIRILDIAQVTFGSFLDGGDIGPAQAFVNFFQQFSSIGELVMSSPLYSDEGWDWQIYTDDLDLQKELQSYRLPDHLRIASLSLCGVFPPFLDILRRTPALANVNAVSIKSFRLKNSHGELTMGVFTGGSIGRGITNLYIKIDPRYHPRFRAGGILFVLEVTRGRKELTVGP